jgi:DNA polymerase elongation subunit (family B)
MFISSFHDRYKDKITVWERHPSGKRITKEYSPDYYFYVPDKLGDFTAVTGETLKKLTFKNKAEFDQGVLAHQKRFESDLNPLEKCMMDNYAGLKAPTLVYGFVDIEVDYDPTIGWSSPSNPYAPINAVTLYRSDLKKYVTYGVPPPGWSKLGLTLPDIMINEDYIICGDELELLTRFLDDIEVIDILSGWNSEFFDLPYIGKRIEMLLGNLGMRKLGFDRAPPPRWGEAERFKGGNKELVLDLMSRVHLDYMRVFKKFNLEGRQSHALAAIADDELDIPKLHYEGSLYELYRGLWRPNLNTLRPDDQWTDLYTAQVQATLEPSEENNNLVKYLSFIEFLVYNRRDVEIIVKIDEKFKYLDTANTMVHEATVNFGSIFGSVQLIDTAIINICHLQLKKIVFDKTHRPKQQVEGALVMTPVIGLHKWIGSVDINSLYPSVYRSLNLSPEKIVGQLMGYEDDWKKLFLANKYPKNDVYQNKTVIFRLEGMDTSDGLNLTAGEMIDLMKTRKFAVSGYGTVLDQGNGEGLLAFVLSYWFKGRKEMQAKKKEFAKKAKSILDNGVKLSAPDLSELKKLL